MWRHEWLFPTMKRSPNKSRAKTDTTLDQLLKDKLKGTLPTIDDLRALHAGQLNTNEAAHIRKHILRSPRLLAQYAALAGHSVDETRQALLNPAPPSTE